MEHTEPLCLCFFIKAFVCIYIQDCTFKITYWKESTIFCTEMLIIAPYIMDSMLACNSKPELGHWVDKWEGKEFECADEWSWWLHRTVIKHYVNSNTFTISLVCQVRYSLAYPSAQISFQQLHVEGGLIHLSQQKFRVSGVGTCSIFFFFSTQL